MEEENREFLDKPGGCAYRAERFLVREGGGSLAAGRTPSVRELLLLGGATGALPRVYSNSVHSYFGSKPYEFIGILTITVKHLIKL